MVLQNCCPNLSDGTCWNGKSETRISVPNYSINYEEVAEWLKKYKATTDPIMQRHLQNVIFLATMPLVKKIVRSLARRNTDPVEDLIQVGGVGLIKAIRQYDSGVGENFRSYATYLISGEIRHYLRDKIAMIRAPRSIYELAYRINKLMLELKDDNGEEPSESIIADALKTSVGKVKEVINVERRKNTISLDQIIMSGDDETMTLFDTIAYDNQYDFESFLEDKSSIQSAIKKLDTELQKIVVMNYFGELSQSEIAKELGITQMQVSRRLKKALKALLGILKEDYAD